MAIYEKLETRPAPSGTKGPINWIKENLFSSLTSSILSILAFALSDAKHSPPSLECIVLFRGNLMSFFIPWTWKSDVL